MSVNPFRLAGIMVLGTAFICSIVAVPAAKADAAVLSSQIAIVVPITVPEQTTGLMSAASLSNLTSPFGLLNRELDQVIDRPVVLAIDPAILASIRVLGTAAPPSAIAWLERLNGATNESFALSYADSDLTAQLQAGGARALAPQSFDFAIDPSKVDDKTLTLEGATVVPSDTATPPQSAYTGQMTSFDYTMTGVAWPDSDTVRPDDLALIAASGYSQTILSSENIRISDRARATASVDGHPIFVSDDILSGLFSSAVDSRSAAEWRPSKNALLDGIASVVAGSASKNASIVLTLDRKLSASDTELGATIDAVSALTNVRTTGLSEIALQPPVDTSIVPKPQSDRELKSVSELLKSEQLDERYSSIAKTPALISAERRLDLLALLSNSWDKNPEGWSLATGSYLAASEGLRSSVQVVPGGSITLLADRASLPVTVSNSLDQSVTVYVVVRPLSPLLAVEGEHVQLTVEPHSQRKGQIPVQSLSNGTVELQVSLVGGDGIQVGTTTMLKTTVQAGWETPVTITIGIVVVLIFIVGIYRNVIRRRRRPAGDAP